MCLFSLRFHRQSFFLSCCKLIGSNWIFENLLSAIAGPVATVGWHETHRTVPCDGCNKRWGWSTLMMTAISARGWWYKKLWRCWRFRQHASPSSARSPVDDYDAAIEMNYDERGRHLSQQNTEIKSLGREKIYNSCNVWGGSMINDMNVCD